MRLLEDFGSPRFRMLHRLWQQYGENILWDAKSTIKLLEDRPTLRSVGDSFDAKG